MELKEAADQNSDQEEVKSSKRFKTSHHKSFKIKSDDLENLNLNCNETSLFESNLFRLQVSWFFLTRVLVCIKLKVNLKKKSWMN